MTPQDDRLESNRGGIRSARELQMNAEVLRPCHRAKRARKN